MSSASLRSDRRSEGFAVRTLTALSAASFPVPVDHDSSAWSPDFPDDLEGQQLKCFRRQTSYGTSFAPSFVEELDRNNPELVVWLKSTSGMLFQGALILFYVLCETAGGLLTSLALKPSSPTAPKPLPSSVIVLNSGSSIIIGVLVTAGIAVHSGQSTIRQSVCKAVSAVCEWRAIISYALVAALFSIAGVFNMMTYSKLDAGLKKILDQLRLPFTAAMGTVLVGKKYSMHEWLALVIVFLAVCCFYSEDLQHGELTALHTKCRYPSKCFDEPMRDVCGLRVDGPLIFGEAIHDKGHVNATLHDITTIQMKESKTDFMGLSFSLIATFFNSVASLLCEKLMKGSATPFPTQKAQTETTGFPVAIAMSFIAPLWIDPQGGKAIWWAKNDAAESGMGFFQGYNGLTLVAVAVDTFLAWMSGIVVKQFSALVQKISKCFILLLTVIVSGTLLKRCQADPLPFTMYALSFITATATVLFATMPKESTAPVRALQTAPITERPGSSAIQLMPQGDSARTVRLDPES